MMDTDKFPDVQGKAHILSAYFENPPLPSP